MTVFCEGDCGQEFQVPDDLETRTNVICICVQCYSNSAHILQRLIRQIQVSLIGGN